MIEQAVGLLYAVTVALKAPVVVTILLALAWSLLEAGVFLRETLERRRSATRYRELRGRFVRDGTSGHEKLRELLAAEVSPDLVRRCLASLPSSPHRPPSPEALLEEMEFGAARRLSRMRVGLRLGPVVGLMGTLIPMGPALRSIAQGNLAGMSSDLIIAFSTTVAGLFVGALCYVMLVVRQYWYARDLADTERLVRIVVERSEP